MAVVSAGAATAAQKWPLTVTDAAGRQVTIPQEPKAILLGSGFNLVALALIHPDPVSLLAGWSQDMKDSNPEFYEGLAKAFPSIENVPLIGDGTVAGLSYEAILSTRADLAILANWQAEGEAGARAMDYLDSIDVPVVVVDFNRDALKNTPVMMRLLGEILGREEQANAFAQFYEDRLARIRQRVAENPQPGPTVLMDAFPNPDRCCWAYGTVGLGAFIGITGSRNIADSPNIPSQGGPVSDEYVLSANPDVYIAAGSPDGIYSTFSVGPGISAEEARATLEEAVGTTVLSNIGAVKSGRVHGIWNFFNAVPLNILAAEAFAHWLRPEIFADIDPDDSLAEINARFAAFPLEGTYWTSLAAPK